MIRIRETKVSDYSAISKLLRESGLAGSWFTKKLFKNLLKRNQGLYFVADNDGKLVGNLFASEDGGYCGHLYKLAVLPEYRRRNVATKLVRKALVTLKKKKIDWAFCHIEKKNTASLAFFKKLGFGIRKTHYLLDNMA